jgi:hypothetical protein
MTTNDYEKGGHGYPSVKNSFIRKMYVESCIVEPIKREGHDPGDLIDFLNKCDLYAIQSVAHSSSSKEAIFSVINIMNDHDLDVGDLKNPEVVNILLRKTEELAAYFG